MSEIANRRFSAVLFDLDGTLLDTLDDIAFSLNSVLEKHGYPTHSTDTCRKMVGYGIRELVRTALPESIAAGPLFDALQNEMHEQYAANWNNRTRIFDGIGALLDAIDRLGIKKAILSNKHDHFTRLCADELLASWTFDIVRGYREGVAHKPDPEGALLVAEELGIEPASILYVGDSGVDMQTAKSAGMYPLGVLWGYRPEEDLRASGAAGVVSSPEEIIGMLTT